MGNTEGWANFLACSKAYLEFGIKYEKILLIIGFKLNIK